MKNAFTMIELIFVIVIIGILAAVAVPRLAATRVDAKIATTAKQVGDALHEIAAYSVSQGHTEQNFSDMSNVVRSLIVSGKAVQSENRLSVKMNQTDDCVILEVNRTTMESNITLSYGSAGTDAACAGLQRIISRQIDSIPLKGKRITY